MRFSGLSIATSLLGLLCSTASFAADGASQIPMLTRLSGPQAGAHVGGFFHSDGETLIRFQDAIDHKVDVIEMDLQLSKDGVVYIWHDESLGRLTHCKGKFIDKLSKDIDKCRSRIGNHYLSKFDHVLEQLAGKGVVLNAEFKTFEVIEPAVRLVQKYQAQDWVYFQTQGKAEKYKAARALEPRVALNYFVKNEDQINWVIAQNDPYLLIVEFDKSIKSRRDLVDKVHAAGKLASINSWNFARFRELSKAACEQTFSHGFDIAISNRVDSCVNQKHIFLGH